MCYFQTNLNYFKYRYLFSSLNWIGLNLMFNECVPTMFNLPLFQLLLTNLRHSAVSSAIKHKY